MLVYYYTIKIIHDTLNWLQRHNSAECEIIIRTSYNCTGSTGMQQYSPSYRKFAGKASWNCTRSVEMTRYCRFGIFVFPVLTLQTLLSSLTWAPIVLCILVFSNAWSEDMSICMRCLSISVNLRSSSSTAILICLSAILREPRLQGRAQGFIDPS